MGHFDTKLDLFNYEFHYCKSCDHWDLARKGKDVCPVLAMHNEYNYREGYSTLLNMLIPHLGGVNRLCRMFIHTQEDDE